MRERSEPGGMTYGPKFRSIFRTVPGGCGIQSGAVETGCGGGGLGKAGSPSCRQIDLAATCSHAGAVVRGAAGAGAPATSVAPAVRRASEARILGARNLPLVVPGCARRKPALL